MFVCFEPVSVSHALDGECSPAGSAVRRDDARLTHPTDNGVLEVAGAPTVCL